MDRLPPPGRARNDLVNRLLEALRSTDGNGVTLHARFCDRCLTFYADSTYGRAAHATGNQLKGIPPCDGSTTNLELMGLNSALASAAVPGPLPPCCTGVSLVPLAVTTSGLSYCFTGSGGPLFREEMGSVIPVDQGSMGGAVLQGQNCFLLSVLRCLPIGLRALATLPSTCALSDRYVLLLRWLLG